MATQAAVLAGFTTTCLIEIHIPVSNTPKLAVYFLHFSAVVSICSNIACVSLSTITSIWGSGKALRGKDGSMDEAVDGMNKERGLIFFAFSLGLLGNLSTVMGACLIIMEFPMSFIASLIVLFTAWQIFSNARRIQKRFLLTETVRLDDLTNYPPATKIPLNDNKKDEAYLTSLPLLSANTTTSIKNNSSSQYSILTGRNRNKIENV